MITGAWMAIVLAQPGLSPDLEHQVDALLPRAREERWMEVPWQRNVMRARELAQKEGKPIFLWAMNGNPFGCT
jgi:hypothetical protein